MIRLLFVGIIYVNRSSPPWRERIPFYKGRGQLYKRESVRERESVCYLVLLAMLSGTGWFVDTHNTIDAQMHVVGSIVIFWYGQCWRLPYRRINVSAHNTIGVLTCLEGYKVPF